MDKKEHVTMSDEFPVRLAPLVAEFGSKAAVADFLGVSRQTVYNWERNGGVLAEPGELRYRKARERQREERRKLWKQT